MFTPEHFKEVFSDGDAGDRLKAVKVVSLPDPGHGALTMDDGKDPGEGKPGDEKPGRGRPGVPRGPRGVTVDQVIVAGDLGRLRFTPAEKWNGDARFTFRVVDLTDLESAAAEATITVTGVGDAPVAGALHSEHGGG